MIAAGAAQFLVVAWLFGGGLLGLPISVPPLPADPLIERTAPADCLLHVMHRGMADASTDSANLTERLVADEDVREFLAGLATLVVEAVRTSPLMPDDAKAAAEHGITLLRSFASRPASLTIRSLLVDPAAGTLAADAAMVVQCGEDAAAVKTAVEALVELGFNGAPEELRPKQVEVGGRTWSRVELPVPGPVTWGFGGKYFILTVGAGATETLLERIGDKTAQTPAWKADLERRMPRERLSTLTYLNAAGVMELMKAVANLGGPTAPPAVLDATGLSGLETVGAVTGLTTEGFASSLWLGFDGPPKGLFAAPAGSVGDKQLRAVPKDAIMAQLWKLDLGKTADAVIELVSSLDPAAGEQAKAGFEQAKAATGIDLEKDLLAPLGDDWRFFVLPGGGLIPSVAIEIGIDDRAAFEQTHDRILGMALAAAGEPANVSVRKVDFHGHVLHCLKSSGEMPLPITPTWCLTEDRLVVTVSPQLMKSLLARKADDPGLGAISEVKQATAAGGQSMVGYLEPSSLVSTLFGLYEMGGPLAEAGLAQQGIRVALPELPPASSVMPNLRPSVTVMRQIQEAGANGLLVESTSTIPLGPLSSGSGLVGASPMSTPVLVALLLPAVQSAREAARRTQTMNNFRQLVFAMLNYEAANGRLPAPAICDKEGKPLLSWRVAMLPYLEENGLYERFKLDEPWDSDHNKALIPLLPEVLRDPAATPESIERGLTTYQLPRGEGTAFPKNAEGQTLARISDGTSKTIGLLEVSAEHAVPWTKPEDHSFDADEPFDGLATDIRPGGLFIAAFLDGHIESLTPDIPPESFEAMVTADAGDMVNSP